jgi:hypothetical protein
MISVSAVAPVTVPLMADGMEDELPELFVSLPLFVSEPPEEDVEG